MLCTVCHHHLHMKPCFAAMGVMSPHTSLSFVVFSISVTFALLLGQCAFPSASFLLACLDPVFHHHFCYYQTFHFLPPLHNGLKKICLLFSNSVARRSCMWSRLKTLLLYSSGSTHRGFGKYDLYQC